jgi:hypothetical protein
MSDPPLPPKDSRAVPAGGSRSTFGKPPKKGRVLTALRRSPLVGEDLDLSRSREGGRKVDI